MVDSGPVAPGPSRSDQEHQIPLVLGAVFLVFLGQMILNPVIAPLAREVGLAEWQVGFTISVAALVVVLTSQLWGRRSQSWGRKPVLLAAFALATVVMALFGVLVQLGMRSVVTGTTLFVLFVLFRGVGFGAAMAAVPPTAQAYIADVTHDEEQRVKAMAGIGAVQGISMIAGSVVGGLLAGLGLIFPVILIPVLLLGGFILIAVKLHPERQAELIEKPLRIRPTDPRVWPFLVAGFGMFTALGFVQIITGFVVQDRFGLDAEATGLMTGGALVAAGIGMVIAQAVVIPTFKWSPVILLRVGSTTALLGFILYVPDLGPVGLVLAVFCVGFGLGIAMPGYTAGPTLRIRRDEQGGLAGLIGATNGLTFVVAPTLGTTLYGLWPQLPIIVGGSIMGCVAVFVWVSSRFVSVPAK